MKRAVAIMAGAAALLGSTSALAQEFSEQGDAAFGADRLFTIHSTHEVYENPGGADSEVDYTGFGFGWNGAYNNPFTIARLGFDFFVIDHLSVGGAIAYSSVSIDNDPDRDTDLSLFLFSPRVGYVWMLGDAVGFWLRGGVSYYSWNSDGWFYDRDGLAFTAEPTFVFVPTEHFAFEVGPFVDWTLFGSRERGNADADRGHGYRTIGLQFGLLGWI